MKKVTYTLDDETVERIERTAARDQRPRSAVVREAVARYAAESGRLSPEDIREQLRIVDAIADMPPTRSARAVDTELRGLEASRRSGWQRPDRRRQ
jgi:predicted transcriptional regulator